MEGKALSALPELSLLADSEVLVALLASHVSSELVDESHSPSLLTMKKIQSPRKNQFEYNFQSEDKFQCLYKFHPRSEFQNKRSKMRYDKTSTALTMVSCHLQMVKLCPSSIPKLGAHPYDFS